MKFSILFISILLAQHVFAQSPEKSIPAKADFVISVNLASLSQKINFTDLGNFSFMQNNMKGIPVSSSKFIKEFFRFPEKGAVNTKGKILMFSENHDSVLCFTYLIAITNNKAFKNRVLEILQEKNKSLKFEKNGKCEVLSYNNCINISVSKNLAAVSMWNRPYYYVYDEELYSQEKTKVIAKIDSIRNAKNIIEEPVKEENKPDTITVFNDNEYIDSSATEIVVTENINSNDYYYTDYENDSLMKQFERNWTKLKLEKEQKFWQTHDKKMLKHQTELFKLKNNETMASDSKFNNIYKLSNDFIIWIPISNYSEKIISAMEKKRYYNYNDTIKKTKESKPNKLAELFENNMFYGVGDFEKGKVDMKFNFQFNDKFKPFMIKMSAGKINPDFFKYIKSDNLIGFAGMSVNTEAWADFYVEVFRRAIESNSNPNKRFAIGLELTDLLINRDVFFHTFRGDGILAFTGMKSYLHTYNSWEYDSITFESRTIEKTKTKYIPEYLCILSIENQVNIDKILSLLVRLDAVKQIKPQVWTLKTGKNEIDTNFYIAKKDDLFFITNDSKLATEQIHGNLSSSRTVGNKYDTLLPNQSFGFWDATSMFKLMTDNNNNNDFGNSAILNKLGNKINNINFYSKPISGNMSETIISFELKNRENSSLLEILNLFEDLNKIK
ncbi:MAG: DUF4836 family protein [Bacteroidetes bacterium]|nr:DUF4836 family protein [Bacteroidota bacterium]